MAMLKLGSLLMLSALYFMPCKLTNITYEVCVFRDALKCIFHDRVYRIDLLAEVCTTLYVQGRSEIQKDFVEVHLEGSTPSSWAAK